MQAELKINRRADKDDLMVINLMEGLQQLLNEENTQAPC